MITNYLSDARKIQLEDAMNLIAQDVIYNVDYKDAKDRLGRIFEELNSAMVSKPFFHYMGNNHNVPESIVDLYNKTWAAHLAPSLLKHVNKVNSDHPCHTAMLDLLNEFAPIMVAFKEAKGKVVKGRKPSTTPRTTKERTTENTGTCGCCGKNVKMDNGKLVSHGYTIKYGFQSGNCFGVGYEPVEVSNRAMVEYMTALVSFKASKEEELSSMAISDWREEHKIESAIRQVTADINYFGKKIAEWTASPLPCTK